jgi:putative transposase
MNRTIKALGVAKSSIYYKPVAYARQGSRRRETPQQAKDAIKELTGGNATYGVPRVRAVLARDYGILLSKYMIHRYMKEEGLLITTHRRRGSSRPHTGKVSVEEPNTRWASDITSIKCWNGEKLRVAIVIDCCDRSIIAWRAGTSILAGDIELMLQEALFKRIGEQALPFIEGAGNQLEFLHDNGPEYIEKALKKQMAEWGLKNCNTPTYSPQSNGICEAFNGTFKRDYVYENCLDDPNTVSKQIQRWIDRYNNYAPHSALGMKTPNQYFNFKNAA